MSDQKNAFDLSSLEGLDEEFVRASDDPNSDGLTEGTWKLKVAGVELKTIKPKTQSDTPKPLMILRFVVLGKLLSDGSLDRSMTGHGVDKLYNMVSSPEQSKKGQSAIARIKQDMVTLGVKIGEGEKPSTHMAGWIEQMLGKAAICEKKINKADKDGVSRTYHNLFVNKSAQVSLEDSEALDAAELINGSKDSEGSLDEDVEIGKGWGAGEE